MKPRRNEETLRRQAIFDYWCKNNLYAAERVSFGAFKYQCDQGRVPGLGPYDFRRTGSDTVTDTTG